MSRMFFIAELSEVDRGKHFFFYFIIFTPLRAKMKQSTPIINVETKVLLQKRQRNPGAQFKGA